MLFEKINNMNAEIKVMMVEDDRTVREGLKMLLNGSPGYRCVAAFSSGEDALAKINEIDMDIILMDIHLPGINGIECAYKVKEKYPQVQIMMLTVFEDNEDIFKSLSAGATGYLLKKTPPAKLLEAISDLYKGGSPMSGEIARKVVETFRMNQPSRTVEENLSKREQEILSYLVKGFLYKEIADQLCISTETVRTHIRNIYDKLHVHTRTEAVLKYLGK